MSDIRFAQDISSMLEIEIGFKGKFILEQQCQQLKINPNEIGLNNLDDLVENIYVTVAGFVGPNRAKMVERGLVEYIEAVKNINKSRNNSLCLVRSHIVLGDKRFYIRKYNEAMESYVTAKNILHKCRKKDLRLECVSRRKLARILSHSKEHYSDALHEYEKSIELGNRLGDWYDVALGHIGLGNIAWQQGDYNGALENYGKASENMEKLPSNTRDEKVRKEKINALIQMARADLHLDINETEKAIDYNERAIEINLDLENYIAVEKLYKKMGIIYKQKKEFERMLASQKKEAFISLNSGPLLMEGWTRMNLASLLIEDGKYNLAEEHLSKAYEIISDFDYPEAHSKLHFIYGNVYQKKNKPEVSENHFLKSLEFLNGKNAPEFYARAQEGLGTLYICRGEKEKGLGLLKSALVWHQNNNNTRDAERLSGLIRNNDEYKPIGIALI